MELKVKKELLNDILNYLSEKPFKEVYKLIQDIHQVAIDNNKEEKE